MTIKLNNKEGFRIFKVTLPKYTIMAKLSFIDNALYSKHKSYINEYLKRSQPYC